MILDFRGMRIAPLLPILPGPLLPGMVAPDRVLSIGSIDLNFLLMFEFERFD